MIHHRRLGALPTPPPSGLTWRDELDRAMPSGLASHPASSHPCRALYAGVWEASSGQSRSFPAVFAHPPAWGRRDRLTRSGPDRRLEAIALAWCGALPGSSRSRPSLPRFASPRPGRGCRLSRSWQVARLAGPARFLARQAPLVVSTPATSCLGPGLGAPTPGGRLRGSVFPRPIFHRLDAATSPGRTGTVGALLAVSRSWQQRIPSLVVAALIVWLAAAGARAVINVVDRDID